MSFSKQKRDNFEPYESPHRYTYRHNLLTNRMFELNKFPFHANEREYLIFLFITF